MANAAAVRIAQATSASIDNGDGYLGDLMSWNHRGVDLPRSAVRDVFERNGFVGVVKDVEPDKAMGRARLRCRNRSITVTACKRVQGDATAVMLIEREVEQEEEERGVVRVYGARTRVVNSRVVVMPPPDAPYDEDCLTFAREMAAYANHLIEFVVATDLGQLLIEALSQLGAVPIRDAGGFYFIPQHNVDRARGLLDGIARLSGSAPMILDGTKDVPVWEGGSFVPLDIPVPSGSKRGVATVATSARDSLQGALSELSQKLQDARNKGGFATGASIESRIKDCQALIDNAALYRGVLAGFVDNLDEQTTALRASFEAELAEWKTGKRPSAALDGIPTIEEDEG